MSQVPFDWSKLPPSPHGDDVFFEMLIPDEIEKLTRLYAAIKTWRDVADREFDVFVERVRKQHTPRWDEYGYDPETDEAILLLDTERVMLANLGVSVAATAENFITRLCRLRHLEHTTAKGKSDFKIACTILEKSLKVKLFDLPGATGNQRARLLGNCFKHNEMKRDQDFVDAFGGKVDELIEYEHEDWDQMIAETRTVLAEIVKRLK